MAEYIEKSIAIAIVSDSADMYPFEKNESIRRIEDSTPAEVAPVVHGRWILRKEPDGHLCFGCSNCGKIENKHTAIKGKYCWSCGAKMDLEE